MLERKWKPATAALLLMLVSFLIILLPVFIFVNAVSTKVGYVINHATELTGSLIGFLKNMESRLGYHFLNEETIRNLSGMALQQLPLILGATVNSLVALVVMYFLLYFMLTNCNKMEDWMEDVLPLRKDNLEQGTTPDEPDGHFQCSRNSVDRPSAGRRRVDTLPDIGHSGTLIMVCPYCFHFYFAACRICINLCSACHYSICQRRNDQGDYYSYLRTWCYCNHG